MAELTIARTYVSRGVNTDAVPPRWSPDDDPPPAPIRSSSTSASASPSGIDVKDETAGPSVSGSSGKKPHWMARAYLLRDEGEQRKDSQIFGEIPGNPVGTRYVSRSDSYTAGVHGVLVAGVHGHPERGAYSIVLSGGYDDDQDLGETFTYTGAGGRRTKDKKGWGHGAQQEEDQSWEKTYNASLKRSCETQNPVRVIRGRSMRQGQRTPFMPADNEPKYRYDGLYVVEKAYQEPGKAGFLMCKFAFKRLPNQPPIPVNPAHPRKCLTATPPAITESATNSSTTNNAPSASAPIVSTPSLVPDARVEETSASAPPVKKKRGRPPGSVKVAAVPQPPIPLTFSSSSDSTNENTSTEPQSTPPRASAKRPRGRPRKCPISAPITEERPPAPSIPAPLPTPPSTNPLPVKGEQVAFKPVPRRLLALAMAPSSPPPSTPQPGASLFTPPPSMPGPSTSRADEGGDRDIKPPWWNYCLHNNKSDENLKSGSQLGDKSDVSMKLQAFKQEAVAQAYKAVLEKLEIGKEDQLLLGANRVPQKGTKRPLESIGNIKEERESPRRRLA